MDESMFMELKRSGRNVLALGFCLIMVFGLIVPSVTASNNDEKELVTFFVATNGSDSNPGTKKKPFQSLEAARDAVRNLKSKSGLPDGGVKVYLREGEYSLEKSFHLGPEDSGEKDKPVVYSAFPGEKVQILGGVSLPGDQFTAVTDESVRSRLQESARDTVVQIDLKSMGITDYGEIREGGYGPFENIVNPELFFNDKAMDLSRYPNEGFVRTGNITVKGGNPRGDGPAPPDKDKVEEEFKKGHTFKYADPRPGQWVDTGDIWIYGYFYWDWADGNLNISNINKEKQEISTRRASWYGIRSNQRYFYYNILEEIDRPGEWYLDRKTGFLYLYPPSDVNKADIKLSLMDKPLFLLEDTSYITLANLEMGYTRGTAVQVLDGSHNTIAGNAIYQTGGFGVTIGDRNTGTRGGHHNGVLSSDISETGIGGIYLAGGDRKSLTPGDNYARNNDIYSFSRIKRTYSPAVQLAGVGNKVTNNYLHDAPHQAISIFGNNHLIEYNEIYNVLTETGDSGAIYMGRDWSEQGNVIRYNYLHKLRNNVAHDQVGIYIDDMGSGTDIYGNLLVDVYRPILIGGGRNNNVHKNVILQGKLSIWIDDRALGWAAETAKPGGLMYQKLQEMPYQQPPWSTQYPHLVSYLDDQPAVPKYNKVTDNFIYDTTNNLEIRPIVYQYGTIERNLFIPKNQGILDKSERKRYKETVNALPVERFGLYNDKFRKNIKGQHKIAALEDMKEEIKNSTNLAKEIMKEGLTDSFENGLALWSTGDGKPATDKVQAHSGNNSLVIDGDRESIFRTMPALLNREVSVWFYDNAANKSLATVARVDDSKTIVAMGVNTNVTKDKYVFRIGGSWKETNVARTDGWHQLTFDYSSGSGVTLLIDGTAIHTSTGITHFNRIGLGDEWADGKSGPVYFDDVVVYGEGKVNTR